MWSPCKVPQGLKVSMAEAFDIPKEKIRVNPVAIGGDFGGKGAPIDEPICLFAGAAQRPAGENGDGISRGIYRRRAAPRRRDALKTGVKRDGTIVAHEMEAFLDAGAYGGFRPGAVIGGVAHARRLLSRQACADCTFRGSTPTIFPAARSARRANPRACSRRSRISIVSRAKSAWTRRHFA